MLQVRCRAEGVRLRTSITRNGTSTCHSEPAESNYQLVFWLYVVFRTCGEMAVIGAVILLRLVTLNADSERAERALGADGASPVLVGGSRPAAPGVRWWLWALIGLVGVAPLAGWVADCAGFGMAFLLGSIWLGLSALGIALSPSSSPPTHHPMLAATLATVEDEIQDCHVAYSPPTHRVLCRDMRAILSEPVALLVLIFLLFVGMTGSIIFAPFYWYD